MLDTARLQKLAISQLEHVLIALKNGDRAYNLRDVLDPWWCYERGEPFVAERRDGFYSAIQFNKPCPWKWRSVLPQFDWMSDGAQKIIEMGEAARISDRPNHPEHQRLIIDHSVPFAEIERELWISPQSWTLKTLHSLFTQGFKRAVISYSENRVLSALKLGSRMPKNWRFGDDPLARYYEAGIESAS